MGIINSCTERNAYFDNQTKKQLRVKMLYEYLQKEPAPRKPREPSYNQQLDNYVESELEFVEDYQPFPPEESIVKKSSSKDSISSKEFGGVFLNSFQSQEPQKRERIFSVYQERPKSPIISYQSPEFEKGVQEPSQLNSGLLEPEFPFEESQSSFEAMVFEASPQKKESQSSFEASTQKKESQSSFGAMVFQASPQKKESFQAMVFEDSPQKIQKALPNTEFEAVVSSSESGNSNSFNAANVFSEYRLHYLRNKASPLTKEMYRLNLEGKLTDDLEVRLSSSPGK